MVTKVPHEPVKDGTMESHSELSRKEMIPLDLCFGQKTGLKDGLQVRGTAARGLDSEMNAGAEGEESIQQEDKWMGLPRGTVVKNPPASAGDTCSILGLGRFHTPRGN